MSQTPQPEIDRPAPGFSLLANGGRIVSLNDLHGSKVVLYFYPKDDTSGCTREALDFTAEARSFQDAGAVVVGVSKDPVSRHDRFVEKHDLEVILVSDADSDLCERYGTWVEKSMYGRRYMGVERSTFLIDSEGVLRRAWRKVKVPGHVAEVLAAVRAL